MGTIRRAVSRWRKRPYERSPLLSATGLRHPRRWRQDPEVIGHDDCPIILRWTLLDFGVGDSRKLPGSTKRRLAAFKVMVHRFPSQADDRVPHDHPRPFWTLVLKGGYEDWVLCEACNGAAIDRTTPCFACGHQGIVYSETLRAGNVRHRPATHTHMTRALPGGAWSVVVMGPLERVWGFWVDGLWWDNESYEQEFGYGMKCGDETFARLP